MYSKSIKIPFTNDTDPNIKDGKLNCSLLIEALWRGKQRYAQKLLAAGVDPNQADDIGHTPLMVAVVCCLPKMVQELVRKGADPNVQDEDGRTVLRMACGNLSSREGTEIVHFLLESGADIAIPDKRGFTAIDTFLTLALQGVHLPDSVAVDELLFDFLDACKSGHLPYLESVDYNMLPQRILNHALVDCAYYGLTDCCVLLISKGADPNGYNIAGQYPLGRAIKALQYNTVLQLIECGALVNGPFTLDDDTCPNTPLVIACQQHDVSSVKEAQQKNFIRIIHMLVSLLLDKGAAPDSRGVNGFTGLRQVVLNSQDIFLMRKLLEYGADPSIKDYAGLSPLEHAEQCCCQDIVNLLRLHSNASSHISSQ